MATLSNSVQDGTLDHILGTSSSTSPSDVYVALYTSDPGRDDSGTEVSEGGYSRQTVTFTSSTDGSSSSDVEVEFGAATEDWGSITHMALHADSSASDLILFGSLDTSRTVNEDDFLRFESGNITVELDP